MVGRTRAEALLVQQRDDAGVGAGPLRVDGLELGAVGVDGVLRVGDGGGVVPLRGLLQHGDAGGVGRHALVEGVGAVGAVRGGEVALQVHHIAGGDLGRDVRAGVLPVEGVGGADDHVDLAAADHGVHRDQLDVVRGGVGDGRAEAGGRLRVHHDGLRALVDQGLDLVVLEARVRPGQQRSEQLDVHLLGVLLLVVDVGGPERGVVEGEVDTDLDLSGGGGLAAAAAARGGAAAAGAAGGEQGADHGGCGRGGQQALSVHGSPLCNVLVRVGGWVMGRLTAGHPARRACQTDPSGNRCSRREAGSRVDEKPGRVGAR